MAEYEIEFRCKECGKPIAILYPSRWAYKVKKGSGWNYFCTWKCLRADEAKQKEKKKEEKQTAAYRDREDMTRKLIRAVEDGENPLEWLKDMGYKNPQDTLRRLRLRAKEEWPGLYKQIVNLGLKDMRGNKGVEKVAKRNQLTAAQKKQAVDIAMNGGDPVKYLEECGAKNPSAAWFYIRKRLVLSNPNLAKKIPGKDGTETENKEGGPVVEIAEKLPPEAVAEVPERLIIREEFKPEPELEYEIMAIKTDLGDFQKDRRDGLVYWTTEEGEKICLTRMEWGRLAITIPKVLDVLGGV